MSTKAKYEISASTPGMRNVVLAVDDEKKCDRSSSSPTTHSRNRGEHDFKKLTIDVCQVFKEVWGKELNLEHQYETVKYWHTRYGFELNEFRLFIQHQHQDESSRAFLSRPGFCNLNAMFTEKRQPGVVDVVEDLKQAKKIQTCLKTALSSSLPDVKYSHVKMRCCGVVVKKKFQKKWEMKDGALTFTWQQDDLEYLNHRCQ